MTYAVLFFLAAAITTTGIAVWHGRRTWHICRHCHAEFLTESRCAEHIALSHWKAPL